MEVIQKIHMAYIEWINSLEDKKEAYTQATVQNNNIVGDQNHDLKVRIFCAERSKQNGHWMGCLYRDGVILTTISK